MSGINKVILVGHLGKDPEIRFFQNGERVASFSLATSNKWKDKATGEQKQQTEWHSIVAFGPIAAVCEQYLNKGDQTYIEGRLKTEKYTDKHNIARYTTKIIAEKIQLFDNRNERKPSDPAEPNGNIALQCNNFDDDIPF